MSVFCTSCGQENGDGAAFCDNCGHSLASGCPSCGADNRPGARFCRSCGTRLVDGSPGPAEATTAAASTPSPEAAAERRVHAEITSIEVTQWQVDSEDALLFFLSHGGEEFLRQNPGAVINLQLVPPKKEGGLIWLASSVAQAGQAVFFVQIDAQTGSAIPQESS